MSSLANSTSRPILVRSLRMQSFRPAASALRAWSRMQWVPAATRASGTVATKAADATDAKKSDTMSKRDLVEAISADFDMSAKDVNDVLDKFLVLIAEAVAEDKKVQLTGFGTFKRSERAARTGRNPSTGAALDIAASAVPTFTSGKKFKDVVKAKYTAPAK